MKRRMWLVFFVMTALITPFALAEETAAGAGVETHGTADQFIGGVAGGAANEGAQAGQHLLHVEGLGDIIVGAGVEALDLVAPRIARREDEHRHRRAGRAPGF